MLDQAAANNTRANALEANLTDRRTGSLPVQNVPPSSPRDRSPARHLDVTRPARSRTVLAVVGMVVAVIAISGCTVVHTGSGRRSPQTPTTTELPTPMTRLSTRATQDIPDPCLTPTPQGASAVAAAYLHAVALATPLWEKIDATIASEGDMTDRNDLMSQVNADTLLRNALRQITFPPTVEGDATALITALDAYISFLTTAYAHHGYLAQHAAEDDQLNETRAEASHLLREDLDLPQSTCVFRRP